MRGKERGRMGGREKERREGEWEGGREGRLLFQHIYACIYSVHTYVHIHKELSVIIFHKQVPCDIHVVTPILYLSVHRKRSSRKTTWDPLVCTCTVHTYLCTCIIIHTYVPATCTYMYSLQISTPLA